MSDQDLLRYCAPTLANVKLGSLFTVRLLPGESLQDLICHVQEKNRNFAPKGLRIHLLKSQSQGGLVYVYREARLKETLQDPETQSFLRQYGYDDYSLEASLEVLEQHLSAECFPHEIGIFLGYPLKDVEGFIANQGKNAHCSGCWKVYHNPEMARKVFEKYKKCVKIYLEKYAQGFDMNRLVVAG